MSKETIVEEKDAYWYRLVLNKFPWFVYSWGTGDREWNYRADLEYLGRGRYWLRNRTCNGVSYKPDERFVRRHSRRCYAYKITIDLIKRIC